jgi:hypothetical protein
MNVLYTQSYEVSFDNGMEVIVKATSLDEAKQAAWLYLEDDEAIIVRISQVS